MKVFSSRSIVTALVILIAGALFSTQTLAAAKVKVAFKNVGYVYDGDNSTTCPVAEDCVGLGDVQIWDVASGKVGLLTNGNRAHTFAAVGSGFPRLYRFEWRRSVNHPYQVIDVWIDIPLTNTWNLTYVFDVPAHRVIFTSDVGNRDIGLLSANMIGDRRQNSRINKWWDPVLLLKGNLTGGLTEKGVNMLDGCYSIYYYADNVCPGNSCVRNYLDYPVCIGGDPGAVNTVHLEDDDMPVIYP